VLSQELLLLAVSSLYYHPSSLYLHVNVLLSSLGTLQYMAPEVFLGMQYGKAFDWWSVGVVYYELLCGINPFFAHSREGVKDRVLATDIFFPDFITEVCTMLTPHVLPLINRLIKLLLQNSRDLISSLLVVQPEDRLGSLKDADDVKQHRLFEVRYICYLIVYST
jgi:serine/threonine protein kinase